MKKLSIDFNGGFPLMLDNLRFMQAAYQQLSAFQVQSDLPLGVDKCIMKGLQVFYSGNNDEYISHTKGVVYFEGEIYEVEALTTPTLLSNPSLILDVKEEFSVIYQDGTSRKVHHIRNLKLGETNDDGALLLLSDLERREVLVKSNIFPSGTVLDVKLSNVQTHFNALGVGISDSWRGWEIDADSKGRVIVGYDPGQGDYNNPDGSKIGGLKEVSLTVQQLATHYHKKGTLDVVRGGPHSHSWTDGRPDSITSAQDHSTGHSGHNGVQFHTTEINADSGDHDHVLQGKVSQEGGGQSHENRQPFIVYLRVVKL